MRVLFDTNVFISYLLKQDKQAIIQSIVDAGIEGKYTLILPSEVISELQKKLTEKPYLIRKIPKEAAYQFLTAMSLTAEFLSPIIEPFPEITRDKKDDYLIAYAVVGECDYLVSGDRDIQVIKQVSNLKILSPNGFYKILQKL